MPELPEVETIARDLRKNILTRQIVDVWTDSPRIVKRPKTFSQFKKDIKNKKIQKIWRRGKNIIFELSENKTLLIHQKLTGHLLLGNWRQEQKGWKSLIPGPLSSDPVNQFLHLFFFLDDDRQLALSDLRKFAKVELWDRDEFVNSEEFISLGPEPLEENFTLKRFKGAILKRKRGKIKQVLMDQKVIAGIGNIYSDETLWEVKLSPFRDISKLSSKELKKIYQAMRKILSKAIELGGESFSDFRRVSGEKGYFDRARKVYRREGQECFRCGTIIKRLKLGGRSAHFCPYCQKL